MPFSKVTKESLYELYIVEDRCKACRMCVDFCPKEILELDMKKFNKKGYHIPKIKDDKSMIDCAGCKYCQLVCPEFSIYLIEKGKGDGCSGDD